MKYLVVGLGNPGGEYDHTRHNVGFLLLDRLAEKSGVNFEDGRHAFIARMKHKGRTYILLKPTTFMNLSGKAVHYWLQKEKIPVDHLLVVVDDIALPTGTIRMRSKGGDGGHNGLKHINETLGTSGYARLRVGVGSDYPKGGQVDYVLGKWTDEEMKLIDEKTGQAIDMILAFGTLGVERTMSAFNNR